MHEYGLRATCCHRRLTNGYYVRFVFALHFCCLLSVGLSFVSGYLVMIVQIVKSVAILVPAPDSQEGSSAPALRQHFAAQ